MDDERPPRLRLVDGAGHSHPSGQRSSQDAAEWEGPPWPHPDDARLRVVIGAALDALERGDVDPAGAVLYAAVHGWFEGALDASEE